MGLIPAPPGRAIIPGEVRYLLEVWHGASLKRSSEFPLVSGFDVQREGPALSLTHTFGKPHRVYNAVTNEAGSIIDGFRERNITLTGSSGADHRLGYDAQGSRLSASGFDVYLELRKFLAGYAMEHAVWEAANEWRPANFRDPEPTLVFRALREDEQYSCDVELSSTRRDVGNLWSYSAQIRCWGPPPGALTLSGLSAFFGSVVGAAKTATEFVDSMTAYVAYATEVTDQTGYVGGTLLGPIAAVGRLGGQLGQLGKAGQRIIQLPQKFVAATFDAAGQGLQAVTDLGEAFTFGTMSAEIDAFRRSAAGELNEARATALAYLGARGVKAGTPAASAAGQINSGGAIGPNVAPRTGTLTTTTVGAFDSMDSILQRLFGGTDRLAEVLELNGMPDPWTLNTGAPLTTGAVLIVPAGSQGIQAVGALVGPDDLYGTDLGICLTDGADNYGDLLAPGTEPDDFALFTGTANLDRALAVRLTTPLGDYGAFPAVGLSIRLGQSNVSISRADVASRTGEQMLRDPRIKRVGPTEITVIDGDRYNIAIEVFPVVGDGVQVAVPV